MATIFAIPTTAPQDARTSELLDRLRDDVIPAATAGTPLKVYVGGNTAAFEDVTDKVAGRLPLFISLVIGLSVLLLMMVFRSLWIPLVSALFNLLSVAAAYGVVVAVFQEGIGASLIGSDSGIPIISFLPVMLFAILFGLSMDYNVFLLSRIHEAYNEGDGPRESVIHGVGRIGKVVVFAGLIMAGVFLGFVTGDDFIGKMFGLGLGLAILIDVLIVRMVIAPAVVTLLGDRAWWLPALAGPRASQRLARRASRARRSRAGTREGTRLAARLAQVFARQQHPARPSPAAASHARRQSPAAIARVLLCAKAAAPGPRDFAVASR